MKNRNSGIDLLRILCMFGVCMLHGVGYGLGFYKMNDGSYTMCQYSGMYIIIQALFIIAVNVFFMMSGYFHRHFRLSKLIELLFQGAFYSCLMYFVACLLGYRNFGILPICRRLASISHWFLTAYIVIYCFSDYIKKFLDSLSDAELKRFIAIYLLLNTYLGFFLNINAYGGAFTVTAMLIVYIIGYAIKRFDLQNIIRGGGICIPRNIHPNISGCVSVAN